MAQPVTPDAELYRCLKAVRDAGNVSAAARQLGIPRPTMQSRMRAVEARGLSLGDLQPPRRVSDDIWVAPAPDACEPIEALLERKRAGMARAQAFEDWAKLIDVQVKQDGPIGVLMVGDPHVDDDHCDIARLEADLTRVRKTPGFYAGHLGDLTNNWVGRLARLYAHQSTTFGDALRLAEWMLELAPNLFVINGNHDCWDNGGDLLRFIVKAGVHQSHGARMALRWPTGKEIRIHARHTFPGRSQYSKTHGMKREVLFGHRDHIIVAGHIHCDEARIEPALDGSAHWFLQVSGYKVIDEYAKTHHFNGGRLASSVAVVIDPEARVAADVVKPFWDVDTAADYLQFAQRVRSK